MNRNTEAYFAELPQVDIGRSTFDRSFDHKTSFNVGQLIPFFWDEVLPGDTFKVTTSFVARLQTLLTPIMDNVYLDTYYFFVPNRIVWNHWKEFMGENRDSAWIPSSSYSVPYVKYPSGGFDIGTIADYLGVPTGIQLDNSNESDWCPQALPFRCYATIADQWFRDQNVTDPLNIPTGDSAQTGTNGSSYVNDVANGGMPFLVSKYHDYFTSCLPSPQKGDPASVAFASIDKYFPVGTLVNTHDSFSTPRQPLQVQATTSTSTFYGIYNNSNDAMFRNRNDFTGAEVEPMNLWSKVTYSSSVSVNELRLAFQLQKFLEKNARAGTRYREVLTEHFGVTVPDARMMIPEYLGGHRVPLNIHQVTNTAASSGENLGDVGAMSNTADTHEDFVKSFTEHGIIMGVCCVRYDHSYPQGLSKEWLRRDKLDYYWPVFANIGEQPVRKGEIMLYSGSGETPPSINNNNKVFGYQEYAAEYRFKPNRVSSQLRPTANTGFASWHLADDYSTVPSLSDGWIREDKTNIDRVLAVTSSNANQVFADFYINCVATRPMPVHSIPGLIDHH